MDKEITIFCFQHIGDANVILIVDCQTLIAVDNTVIFVIVVVFKYDDKGNDIIPYFQHPQPFKDRLHARVSVNSRENVPQR